MLNHPRRGWLVNCIPCNSCVLRISLCNQTTFSQIAIQLAIGFPLLANQVDLIRALNPVHFLIRSLWLQYLWEIAKFDDCLFLATKLLFVALFEFDKMTQYFWNVAQQVLHTLPRKSKNIVCYRIGSWIISMVKTLFFIAIANKTPAARVNWISTHFEGALPWC